jgi:hypothetical protein
MDGIHFTVNMNSATLSIKHDIRELFLNNIKSDMVEAIAHVPFSMHQYYCTPNSNFRGYNCTLKKFPVPPKWWRREMI